MTREPTQSHRRRTGEDKFGRFVLTGGPCTNCGKGGQYCVKYAPLNFELPDGIDVGHTILKDPLDGYLGISCGCYSKLHRQVTIITVRMEARKQRKSV